MRHLINVTDRTGSNHKLTFNRKQAEMELIQNCGMKSRNLRKKSDRTVFNLLEQMYYTI